MSGPAVLEWNRSVARCLWTGVLGLLGLAAVIAGWAVLTFTGSWSGLAVLAVGLLVFGLSELWARRFRQVTTRGLRWQRSLHTDEFDWGAVGFSTQAPPEAAHDAPDRILVHGASGVVTWPHPVKHQDCVVTVGWWQRAQHEFRHGEFRAFPGLRPNLPHPYRSADRMHNLGRRWWQGILGVIMVLTTLACLMAMITRTTEPTWLVGWAIAALAALAGAWVSLRNATSSVRLEPHQVEHRRWFARRTIPWEAVAGCYVATRPRVVGLGALTVVFAIISFFDSGDAEGPDHKNVPTLLLRDGTAFPLTALASRSGTRVHRFAQEVLN
ncbi:hypothetical protein ACQBAU_07000 [Propionibacteriaceae bacterium Y2011]